MARKFFNDRETVEAFDADAILNSAEAELFNSNSDIWASELSSLDAVDYCSSIALAMAIDW